MTTDVKLKEAVETALFMDGISSKHVGDLADAVLAAIRASGRLAPEVAGDVVEAAVRACLDALYPNEDTVFQQAVARPLYDEIAIAAPLIAAAAEAKAREECVRIVQQYSFKQEDVFHDCVKVWDAEHAGVACSEIIAAIRTGSAS